MDPQTSYEAAFWGRLRWIAPDAALSSLHLLPEEIGCALLREILKTGCLSQNTANIQLARQAVAQIDPGWLAEHLPLAAEGCLFQEPAWQEWEFRRLAEMLQGPYAAVQHPDAFLWLTAHAGTLGNAEVEEAAAELLENLNGCA